MGAYEGDPNSFPATLNLPDDGQEVKATVVNLVNEPLADRTAWLKARMVYGAQNIQPLPNTSSFFNEAAWAFAYDATPGQKRWLAAANDVSDVQQLFWTTDNAGGGWNQLGSSGFGSTGSFTSTSIAVDPSTGIISLIHGNLYKKVTPAGVYSGGTLPVGTVVAPYGAVNGWKIWNGTRFFKGLYIALGIATTASAPFQKFGLLTSPDAVTWTDRSTSLPVGLNAWEGVEDIIAHNGSILVAWAPVGAFHFVTTTDGLTWTTGAAITAMGAGDIVTSVAWSESDQVFLACCQANADDVTSGYILKSADGLSWTKISTLTGGYQPLSIGNVGLIWLCVVSEPGTGGADDQVYRTLISTDAGVTWALSPGDYAGTTNFLSPNIYSSGSQFLIACNMMWRTSLYMGEVPAGL